MFILIIFDVIDSKSATGGSCVFYATLFVLFVIMCCSDKCPDETIVVKEVVPVTVMMPRL